MGTSQNLYCSYLQKTQRAYLLAISERSLREIQGLTSFTGVIARGNWIPNVHLPKTLDISGLVLNVTQIETLINAYQCRQLAWKTTKEVVASSIDESKGVWTGEAADEARAALQRTVRQAQKREDSYRIADYNFSAALRASNQLMAFVSEQAWLLTQTKKPFAVDNVVSGLFNGILGMGKNGLKAFAEIFKDVGEILVTKGVGKAVSGGAKALGKAAQGKGGKTLSFILNPLSGVIDTGVEALWGAAKVYNAAKGDNAAAFHDMQAAWDIAQEVPEAIISLVNAASAELDRIWNEAVRLLMRGEKVPADFGHKLKPVKLCSIRDEKPKAKQKQIKPTDSGANNHNHQGSHKNTENNSTHKGSEQKSFTGRQGDGFCQSIQRDGLGLAGLGIDNGQRRSDQTPPPVGNTHQQNTGTTQPDIQWQQHNGVTGQSVGGRSLLQDGVRTVHMIHNELWNTFVNTGSDVPQPGKNLQGEAYGNGLYPQSHVAPGVYPDATGAAFAPPLQAPMVPPQYHANMGMGVPYGHMPMPEHGGVRAHYDGAFGAEFEGGHDSDASGHSKHSDAGKPSWSLRIGGEVGLEISGDGRGIVSVDSYDNNEPADTDPTGVEGSGKDESDNSQDKPKDDQSSHSEDKHKSIDSDKSDDKDGHTKSSDQPQNNGCTDDSSQDVAPENTTQSAPEKNGADEKTQSAPAPQTDLDDKASLKDQLRTKIEVEGKIEAQGNNSGAAQVETIPAEMPTPHDVTSTPSPLSQSPLANAGMW